MTIPVATTAMKGADGLWFEDAAQQDHLPAGQKNDNAIMKASNVPIRQPGAVED